MIRLMPPPGESAAFYLAAEEYVAARLGAVPPSGDNRPEEVFFLWQTGPSVICGRNQVMEAEVNLPFCRARGIRIYRRKSGGGCVYADAGNLMVSYISNRTDRAAAFDLFLQRMVPVLRGTGLRAERSGRNDILIDSRKISGNSFFLLPHSGIVHGTLLFDTDLDLMANALTPPEAKIRSKGVASVRQRVTNIREELLRIPGAENEGLTDLETFKRRIAAGFCGETLPRSPAAGAGQACPEQTENEEAGRAATGNARSTENGGTERGKTTDREAGQAAPEKAGSTENGRTGRGKTTDREAGRAASGKAESTGTGRTERGKTTDREAGRAKTEESGRAVRELRPEEIAAIREIEAGYLEEAFLRGRRRDYSLSCEGRIEGVGTLRAEFALNAGLVEGCSLTGDLFPLREDVDEILTERLRGRECTPSEIAGALEGLDLKTCVLHLDTKDFIGFLWDKLR